MKYASLAAHLRSLDANRWTASFDQLEGILGDKLPRSAHQHRAWWANTDSHVQATAWLEAGWQVESVHPSRQQVTFRRLRHSSGFARKREAMETRPTATNSSLPHSWDRSDDIECRVRLQWKPIGRVEMDVSGKLRFPVATSGPGLYRFTIDDSQVYVGESENVQRRFQHYRTPGPSQQTNIRMNRIFSEALRRRRNRRCHRYLGGSRRQQRAVCSDRPFIEACATAARKRRARHGQRRNFPVLESCVDDC